MADEKQSDFFISELHAPRKQTSLGKKYTAFVKMMKVLFFTGFVVMFSTIIAYLSGTDSASLVEKGKSTFTRTTPGQIEVDSAKYEGVDAEGNPYTITADKANRSTTREDGVLIDNPITDIILDNKSWIALKALGGFFNSGEDSVMLEGDVKAYHDSGYEILMRDIVINLKEKSGSTASPVIVQGPLGSARAQNMEVKPNLEKIILGGPVSIKINDLSLVKG